MPESQGTTARPAQELVCWKVWGGNGQVDVPIAIPGLRGRLYSRPAESDQGGDLYYLSACGSGALARMCVADVTGHGSSVATFSAWLEEVFSSHIHRANPSAVLRKVNERAASRGLEVMSTAICLSYNSLNGRLAYCNAGHPPIRICRAGRDTWEPLRLERDSSNRLSNVPLAVDGTADFTMGRTQLRPGDRLLIHTDGLTEAFNEQRTQLGASLWTSEGLPGSNVSIDGCLGTIQRVLAAHTGNADDMQDDVTFMIVEALPYQRGNRYSLLVKNNFNRLVRALRR